MTNRSTPSLLTVCAAAVLTTALSTTALAQTDKAEAKKTGPEVKGAKPMQMEPAGKAPKWAKDIDPQMQVVIDQLKSDESPKFTELTPFQVRNAKLPSEAVAELLMKTGTEPQAPKVDISHKVLPVGPEEGILTRLYTPLEGEAPFPVIVYYHGGGWVIADLETYEPSAKALAAKTGAIVVSVAYRQAPEHPFPAAHEDAFAAYKWVMEHAAEINGDPARIATAGESAGGNLAVAVPLMAAQRNVPMPLHILSVYPIADGDVKSDSYDTYADAVPLNRPLMEWFFDEYSPNWRKEKNPLISLTSADLKGLPPTTIINAQIDPLEAEGGELAQMMKKAGVEVTRKVYPGVTHEFFGMAAVLDQAEDAQNMAADQLKQAFTATPAPAITDAR